MKINESKGMAPDFNECLECKNHVNLTWINKIKERFSDAWLGVIAQKNYLVKYKFDLFKMESVPLLAKAGKVCIEKYENVECPNEKHAIIIINNTNASKNDYVFGSGVDILVEYCNLNSIKFKIYNCYTPECFYIAIKESKAQHLWIFGHGDRHGVSFGKGGYCPFCKVIETNRKSFIAQLHCCHHTGKTLWEYLSDKPGIFSEGLRDVHKNREDITQWIKDNEI